MLALCIGSDLDLKIGNGCSVAKHSVFRNKSHESFGGGGGLKNATCHGKRETEEPSLIIAQRALQR